MQKLYRMLCLLTVSFLIVAIIISTAWAATIKIEKTAIVTRVIDGDTFDLNSGERVRLADINTPEIGEPGYEEAKNFLTGRVQGKTVFLDIDDVSRTDEYDRLICVAYVDHNSTHYENLNKALLENNYAVVYEFSNNEFNPSSWSWFIEKATPTQTPTLTPTTSPTATPTATVYSPPTPTPQVPEFPALISLLIAMSAVSVVVLSHKRRSRRL